MREILLASTRNPASLRAAHYPVLSRCAVFQDVPFSSQAPGFVGLYQVNVLIPLAEWTVNKQPVLISIGGVQSNMVTIAAQQGLPTDFR